MYGKKKTLKRWLFEDRDESRKYVSPYSHRVTERPISLVQIIGMWAIGLVGAFVPAFLLWLVWTAPGQRGPIYLVMFGLAAFFIIPWTILAIIIIPTKLKSGVEKYIMKPTTCDYCGAPHRHGHRLTYSIERADGKPGLIQNMNGFCSRDCRAAYERVNISESDPDIQTERDWTHNEALAEWEFWKNMREQ